MDALYAPPAKRPQAGALSTSSAAPVRRGVSGILEAVPNGLAVDASTRFSQGATAASSSSNALLGHRTVQDLLEAAGPPGDAAMGDAPVAGTTFPTIAYYGVLRGLCLEIPVLRAAPTATATTGSDRQPQRVTHRDGAPLRPIAAKLHRLPCMLEEWSRRGGGQSYRFGASWGDMTPAAAPQLLHMVVGGEGAHGGDGSSKQRPPPPPLKGSALAPQQRGRALLSPVWYGEYVEALTDGILQFFRLAGESSNSSGRPGAAGAGVIAPPVVLYVELHRHNRWRDIAVQFFVENDVTCCFVATQHRPSQRYFSNKCSDLDVDLQWVHGAALVSSSPLGPNGGAGNTNRDGDGMGECGAAGSTGNSGKAKRRRSPADGCRVLADILLNLNLLSFPPPSDGTDALNNHRPHDSALLGSQHVSVAASYPFLHGTWASHRLRPQGLLVSRAGNATAAPQGDAERTAAAQCFMSVVAQDATVGAAGNNAGAAQAAVGVGAASLPSSMLPPLESCFSKSAPLFGTSIASLLGVLIEGAELHHFRLRFACYPSAKSRTRDGYSVARRAAGTGPSGEGAVALAGNAAGGIASVQANGGGNALDVVANASSCETLSNGLCFSRLSSAFWLSEAEKSALGAAVQVDPLDGADDADGPPPSTDEIEAEFYPLVIEYRRTDLAPQQRSPADPHGWGPFFFVKNCVMSAFDG